MSNFRLFSLNVKLEFQALRANHKNYIANEKHNSVSMKGADF